MKSIDYIYECFDPKDLKVQSTFERRSGVTSKDKFKRANYFHLAHFTSSILLKSILEKGLLPNSISGRKIEDNLSTDPNSVYLSAIYDSSYLKRTIKEFGGEGIIIMVEVEKHLLEADENLISFNSNSNSPLKDEELLYNSMSFMGACKYKGIIDPNKILGVYSREGKQLNVNK
ncbi:hypothetical protein GCM10009865_32300 [Aeromicrobium ponti]|uniref:Uncharacterized protein n=1 Tax=Cytobacillus oceanisediminis TaxID=665099 RepID=A0A562JRH3_9BACI|nr:hypothetical protein [Cytobacillus oceanisediminis]TWH85728.1 hypothetical protein IQ19_03153 [Cytobacillus oceanisediminis]